MKFKMTFSVLIAVFAIVVLMGFSSCSQSDSPSQQQPNPTTSSFKAAFNTENGGSLETGNGVQLTVPLGAVPYQDNGSLGEVLFTIKPDIKQTDLPAQIPSAYQLVGSVYLFGPDNFVFQSPLQIILPASSESSPMGLAIARYSTTKKEWVLLPVSIIDDATKKIGCNTLELGYFAVVRAQSLTPIVAKSTDHTQGEDTRVGGLRFKHNMTDYLLNDYYVTITVIGVVYKYPDIPWPNELGDNGTNGSDATGIPKPVTYLGNIPQGDYTIQLSRIKRGTMFAPPGKREVYTKLVTIAVKPYCSPINGWTWDNWGCWTDIIINKSDGGEWDSGEPNTWKKHSVPTPTNPTLVAFYPFNGNALDASGSGANGTVMGATLCADRNGKPDKAYEFKENDNAIKFPLSGFSSLSVSLWYNASDNIKYHYPTLFSYQTQSGKNILTAFIIQILGNNPAYAGKVGTVNFSLSTNNGSGQNGAIQSKSIPTFNNWHHVCAIYNMPLGRTYLYIDNVLADSNSCNFNLSCNEMIIGTTFDKITQFNTSFRGKIDDIKIFSGAISPAKVTELFNEIEQ